jgi:hypothetical protein
MKQLKISSPTDHATYPKSFEAQRHFKVLCDEPIDLPIPTLYELLQFQYNDTYFYTRVKTAADLQEEIQVGMTNLYSKIMQ